MYRAISSTPPQGRAHRRLSRIIHAVSLVIRLLPVTFMPIYDLVGATDDCGRDKAADRLPGHHRDVNAVTQSGRYDRPSITSLRHLLHPPTITRDGNLEPSVILNCGGDANTFFQTAQIPPSSQIRLLEIFVWAANFEVFAVTVGRAPLLMSTAHAEVLWNILVKEMRK